MSRVIPLACALFLVLGVTSVFSQSNEIGESDTVVDGNGAALGALDPHYQKNVGESSYSILQRESTRAFSQLGYLLQSETVTPPPTIFRETQWREREPFSEEAEQGVLKARTKIILQSRGTGSRSGGGALSGSSDPKYRIRMRIENQVMLDETEGWTEIDMVEEFEEWAEKVVRDFEADLRARN